MGIEIFQAVINERAKTETTSEVIEDEANVELADNEVEKAQLLALIPEEIRERSYRENFSVDHIKKIIEFREKKGMKMVLGYHVSPYDLRIGENITSGQDTKLYFSTSLQNLYAGKTPRYIYALECSEAGMQILDENLNWYTTRGELKILDKIKMTHEAVEALGVKFSQCEYR